MNKYYTKHNNKYHMIITERNYNHTYTHIKKLVNQAIFDFPDIQDGDIRVEVWGGNTNKGMMGIEFSSETKPDGYKFIENFRLVFPVK